ncbi:cytochrome P450 [Halomarina litorea]|nr:cytochrome P450 [Halomarina sp. BCD28]
MLEARLVLATVLRTVHLELVTEPPLDLSASLTTRPTEPVEMRVHTR